MDLVEISYAGSAYLELQNGTKIMFIVPSKLELLTIKENSSF